MIFSNEYYHKGTESIHNNTLCSVIKIINSTISYEVITITRRVLGPIIVPNTPDCDYPYGEELLSYEKIEALKESFKEYGIIDYQHQFTDETKPYFMKNIGTPVRMFSNDSALKFEDVTGMEIEVPSGTLWLESNIDDKLAEKEIDEKQLVAYSITVSEKSDAETVMDIYNKISTKTAQKEDIDMSVLNGINEKLSNKRTLIKDINDPVMLTTSLVKFPCVNKARFCKHSIEQVSEPESKGSEKMAEKPNDANTNFIKNIQTIVNKYRKESKEELGGNQMDADEVNTIVDEKLEAFKSDISKQITDNQEEVLTAIKDLTTAPSITDDDIVTEPVREDDDEVVVDEPDKEEEVEAEPEPVKEDETKKTKKTRNGKGGKSKKSNIPLKEAEPSAQKSRQNGKIEGEKKEMAIKRDEFAVIADTIRNAKKNKFSTKSIDLSSISYEATGLTKYNRKYMDTLEDPILLNAYKASLTFKDGFTIDETNTRRAILNTNVFTSYVTKIIQDEPLLQDVQYQTGLHGKGHIYELDDTITTEDGALPEHYYFDKDVAEQQATISDREIETYPQRTKINISDRQRLANVYGDDLVNILLERTVKRLKRGVATARFYGNSNAANTVDLQFRRHDGYLKEAGQQLTSADVNLDKITDIFDSMFYALPEEAQVESECIFYVPTNIRRAYSSYFLDKAADRAIDFIGQKTPLYWGESEIKVSPTLNDKPMRDLLDDGNVSVLLIKPGNTHFIVGREAGIEPKRYAETSSDAYYATMDSANAYTINDYAVRLSLTADEYAGLLGNSEEEGP